MLEIRSKGVLKRGNSIIIIIACTAYIGLIMLLQGQRQLINLSYLYVRYVLCKPHTYSHRYTNVSQLRAETKGSCELGVEVGVAEWVSASNLLSQAVRGFWPYLFLLLYAYADIYTYSYYVCCCSEGWQIHSNAF